MQGNNTITPEIVELIEQHINFNQRKQVDKFVNEEEIALINPDRIFKDCTTSIYTSVFLENTKKRTAFVDFVYHMLNTNIQLCINYYLIQNNEIPLQKNEKIFLYFKGGNIMNYYFKKYADNSNNQYTYIDQINAELKKNFKISDVDFTIYITTDGILDHHKIGKLDQLRHDTIRKYVTIIATNALYKITTYFDKLLNAGLGNDNTQYLMPDDILLNCGFGDTLNYIDQTEFINMSNMDPNDGNSDNILNEIEQYMEIVLNASNNNIAQLPTFTHNKSSSLFAFVYAIQIIQYYIYYGKTDLVDNKSPNRFVFRQTDNKYTNTNTNTHDDYFIKKIQHDVKFNSYVKNLVTMIVKKIYLKSLRNELINFYSDQDINKFKIELSEELNKINLNKKYFSPFDSTETSRIKAIQPDDLEIKLKGSFIMYHNNNKMEVKLTTDLQYHYISFSTLINTKTPNDILNFTLLRSKLYVICNNGLLKEDKTKNKQRYVCTLPSEFIDISIPVYDDTGLRDFFEHKYEGKSKKNMGMIHLHAFTNKYDNKRINALIGAYTMRDTLHDLRAVLFDSKFFPWIDAKYQKRMYRYLFFSIINEKCVDKCNFDVIINFASNINNVIRNPNKSGLLKIDLINNLFAKNIDKLDDEFEIINNDYDNYNNNIIIHNKNDIIELVKNNMTHFAGNMISKKYTIRPHQLFNKNYNSQYKDYYVIMNLILVCYYLCYLEKDLIKNELIDYIRKFYGYVPLEELKKYRRAVTNNVEIFGFEEISLSNKDIQEMFAQFLEFIEKSKTYIDFVKNAFNKNTLKRNMTNSLVGGDENSAIKPNITNLYHINNKYKQKYLEQKLLYLDNKNENLNKQFELKVKSSYVSTMYDGIADDKSLIEITYI